MSTHSARSASGQVLPGLRCVRQDLCGGTPAGCVDAARCRFGDAGLRLPEAVLGQAHEPPLGERGRREARGRYSIIAFEPDLVWRASGNTAEVSVNPLAKKPTFKTEAQPTLSSLRSLLSASRLELPPDLRPWLPACSATWATTRSGSWKVCQTRTRTASVVPDAVLIRPTIVVIFDNVKDEMTLVTPVRAEDGKKPTRPIRPPPSGLERVIEALGETGRACERTCRRPANSFHQSPSRTRPKPNTSEWSPRRKSTSALAISSRSYSRSASRRHSRYRHSRSIVRCGE